MWQHWVNFVLGIVLLIVAYTGASVGVLAAIAVLLIIVALWGALAGTPSGSRTMRTQ
jgi:hypothetical protein